MITQPCPECGYWTGHGPTCTYQSRVTIRTTSTDSVPMTTDNKRDPNDVLREWDSLTDAGRLHFPTCHLMACTDNEAAARLSHHLASALRDTLAEKEKLQAHSDYWTKELIDMACQMERQRDAVVVEKERLLASLKVTTDGIEAALRLQKAAEAERDQLRTKLDKAEAVVVLAKELQSFGLIEPLGVKRNSFRVSEELDAALAAYDNEQEPGQ